MVGQRIKGENMSRYRNMIEVSLEKNTPQKEHFYYRNLDCPYCQGRGFTKYYDGRLIKVEMCTKCDGVGKMMAHVTVEFKPDY